MEGKRIPSHTDRILMIKKVKDIIVIKGYTMDEKTAISDHKPVVFGANLKIKKMLDKDLQNEFDKKLYIFLTHG